MNKTKSQRAITLVALIITIIVLLILVVVAIRAVQGDGIIQYAKNATNEYEEAKGTENAVLDNYLVKLKEKNPGNSGNAEENDLVPGLYDAEDVLLASWDSLVNDYGFDVENDYTLFEAFTNASNMPKSIIENNTELSTGVKIVVGDDITKIGDYAFYNFTALKSVTCGSSVTTIGQYTFSSCTSLESITILPSVKSILEQAFSNCTSLESITIPGSVIGIGQNAFRECTSLTGITFEQTEGWYCNGEPVPSLTDTTMNVEYVTITYSFGAWSR